MYAKMKTSPLFLTLFKCVSLTFVKCVAISFYFTIWPKTLWRCFVAFQFLQMKIWRIFLKMFWRKFLRNLLTLCFYKVAKRKKGLVVLVHIGQGPLYKWTEHSLKFHYWNYKVGGTPITPRGWMGVDGMDLDHNILTQNIHIKIFFMRGQKKIWV